MLMNAMLKLSQTCPDGRPSCQDVTQLLTAIQHVCDVGRASRPTEALRGCLAALFERLPSTPACDGDDGRGKCVCTRSAAWEAAWRAAWNAAFACLVAVHTQVSRDDAGEDESVLTFVTRHEPTPRGIEESCLNAWLSQPPAVVPCMLEALLAAAQRQAAASATSAAAIVRTLLPVDRPVHLDTRNDHVAEVPYPVSTNLIGAILLAVDDEATVTTLLADGGALQRTLQCFPPAVVRRALQIALVAVCCEVSWQSPARLRANTIALVAFTQRFAALVGDSGEDWMRFIINEPVPVRNPTVCLAWKVLCRGGNECLEDDEDAATIVEQIVYLVQDTWGVDSHGLQALREAMTAPWVPQTKIDTAVVALVLHMLETDVFVTPRDDSDAPLPATTLALARELKEISASTPDVIDQDLGVAWMDTSHALPMLFHIIFQGGAWTSAKARVEHVAFWLRAVCGWSRPTPDAHAKLCRSSLTAETVGKVMEALRKLSSWWTREEEIDQPHHTHYLVRFVVGQLWRVMMAMKRWLRIRVRDSATSQDERHLTDEEEQEVVCATKSLAVAVGAPSTVAGRDLFKVAMKTLQRHALNARRLFVQLQRDGMVSPAAQAKMLTLESSICMPLLKLASQEHPLNEDAALQVLRDVMAADSVWCSRASNVHGCETSTHVPSAALVDHIEGVIEHLQGDANDDPDRVCLDAVRAAVPHDDLFVASSVERNYFSLAFNAMHPCYDASHLLGTCPMRLAELKAEAEVVHARAAQTMVLPPLRVV